MNFCSNCGSDRIEVRVPEGDDRHRYFCPDCEKIHYQNPRIIVGCLPLYEDRILMCRRAIDPMYGYWNLPAGFLEKKETVQEGAKRETWEEAKADVEIKRLHCIYDLPHADQVYLHFLARVLNQDLEAGEESLEVELFKPEDIPWNEIAFSSTTFALEKFLKVPEQEKPHLGAKPLSAQGTR